MGCVYFFGNSTFFKVKIYVLFLLLLLSYSGVAQKSSNDSLSSKIKVKSLLIPISLISYGAIGIESDGLQVVNSVINEAVDEHIDEKISIDDFAQYTPMATVYGLDYFGIKAKNTFRDRSLLLATSYATMGITVYALKTLISIKRPDGTSYNSFPSGHTATAFLGAEFLWQEYKHQSKWFGAFGYLVAAGTGLFRIHNDRHWFTDVMTGAGIGMLSVKLAYQLNPFITERLFKRHAKDYSTAMVYPFYNGAQYGVGFALSF